jgi:hypothetical protein
MHDQKSIRNALPASAVEVEVTPVRSQVERLAQLLSVLEHRIGNLEERVSPYIDLGSDNPSGSPVNPQVSRPKPYGSAIHNRLYELGDTLDDLNERLYRTTYSIQQ